MPTSSTWPTVHIQSVHSYLFTHTEGEIKLQPSHKWHFWHVCDQKTCYLDVQRELEFHPIRIPFPVLQSLGASPNLIDSLINICSTLINMCSFRSLYGDYLVLPAWVNSLKNLTQLDSWQISLWDKASFADQSFLSYHCKHSAYLENLHEVVIYLVSSEAFSFCSLLLNSFPNLSNFVPVK